MAGIVGIASLIGTGVQALGQLQSGSNEQYAYNARAYNAELDAREYMHQAQMEKAATDLESQQLRRRIRKSEASQRSAVAKSGLALSGSARQVLNRNANEQEQDALSARFNGMNRQLGKERSAQISRGNASTLRAEGRLAKSQRKSSAFSSLLTGGVNAASSYYSMGGKFGRNWF